MLTWPGAAQAAVLSRAFLHVWRQSDPCRCCICQPASSCSPDLLHCHARRPASCSSATGSSTCGCGAATPRRACSSRCAPRDVGWCSNMRCVCGLHSGWHLAMSCGAPDAGPWCMAVGLGRAGHALHQCLRMLSMGGQMEDTTALSCHPISSTQILADRHRFLLRHGELGRC